MTTIPLFSLWNDVWTDFQNPSLLWQVATLAFCLVGGWGLARLFRGVLVVQGAQSRMARFGVENFTRVFSPLLALTLLVLAKPILAQWHHVNLLRVAIPLVSSFLLIRLAFYVFRRVFVRGGEAGGFFLLFEKVFATVVWFGVALYITGVWPELARYLDDIVVPVGRNKISVLTILQAAISVLVTLLVALWAGALLEERLMRLDTVHSSVRVVMARMVRALLILVALLVSLSLVGIDLTVLSVFGGALGVGIGLGLQKIVSSYVSGFVILLERSLSIGDMVAVDKYSGKVTQINTRYTVLQGMDGVESVVPNDMLISGPVQNYSLTDKSLRLATQLSVSYETNVEHVLRLLEEATLSIDRVSKNPAPAAALIRFGADGLELEVGFWIADPENGRMNVVSKVNLAIWRTLQNHQITIPYPQREIRMIGDAKG